MSVWNDQCPSNAHEDLTRVSTPDPTPSPPPLAQSTLVLTETFDGSKSSEALSSTTYYLEHESRVIIAYPAGNVGHVKKARLTQMSSGTTPPRLHHSPPYQRTSLCLDGCGDEPSCGQDSLLTPPQTPGSGTWTSEESEQGPTAATALRSQASDMYTVSLKPTFSRTEEALQSPTSQPYSLSPLKLRRFPSGSRASSSVSPLKKKDRLTGYQSPDRFVPGRDLRSTSRQAYMLARPPSGPGKFGKPERQQSPAADPFGPARQPAPRPSERIIRPRIPVPARPTANRLIPARVPPAAVTAVIPDRNISQGAVWNVGGSGVVVDGVHSISNGRGGRTTTGTNAPMYIADFFSKDDPTLDDHGRHQDRLAIAFDVDPTRRILESPDSERMSCSSTPSTPGSITPSRSRSGSVQSSVS